MRFAEELKAADDAISDAVIHHIDQHLRNAIRNRVCSGSGLRGYGDLVSADGVFVDNDYIHAVRSESRKKEPLSYAALLDDLDAEPAASEQEKDKTYVVYNLLEENHRKCLFGLLPIWESSYRISPAGERILDAVARLAEQDGISLTFELWGEHSNRPIPPGKWVRDTACIRAFYTVD